MNVDETTCKEMYSDTLNRLSCFFEKVEKICLDREKDSDFAKKIAELEPDIVVDLINFHFADTQKMVEALKDTKISHYLFCSSIIKKRLL